MRCLSWVFCPSRTFRLLSKSRTQDLTAEQQERMQEGPQEPEGGPPDERRAARARR